jgi:hypothetical protein
VYAHMTMLVQGVLCCAKAYQNKQGGWRASSEPSSITKTRQTWCSLRLIDPGLETLERSCTSAIGPRGA